MSLATICPEGNNFLFISSLESNKREYEDDTVKYCKYENENTWRKKKTHWSKGLRLMKKVNKNL